MTQDKPTDMTAEEFFNGIFNMGWMTEEEKQAIYSAAELFAEGKVHQASLNRQGWTRVEDGLPETLGEDILICYEMGGQTIIEIGYLCGERLIKGTTERYPPVTHWMPLPNKPSI